MTNNSLTILAPSPINFWTSSEPETLIKVHSVWCATARARSVFPVPGGPYSNTPWKNLMISTCISKKLHLHRTVLSIFKMFLFKSISLFEICVDVFHFASCHFILDNRDLEQFQWQHRLWIQNEYNIINWKGLNYWMGLLYLRALHLNFCTTFVSSIELQVET